jgi:hypothetical protein
MLWLLAISLGAIHAGADRFYMNADGISYIDMGGAYWRGDWTTAINGYWSPLYSWLVGLFLWLFTPTPYWEFPVVHVVNFIAYLVALACFHVFLRELMTDHTRQDSLPEWAWILLGYSLFIWSSLTMVTMAIVTPDMCVVVFVYLAATLVLRIRRSPASWVPFVLLGLVLGVGYLAKFAMLPLAIVFVGIAVLSQASVRRALPRAIVTVVVFLVMAGPFIVALSTIKGRFTFGDTATLNYLQHINGAPTRHWQGGPPGRGMPTHPTRKIFDTPAIYEYGDPIHVTYPPWFDPSYWNDGIVPVRDLRKQMSVAARNLRGYLDMFLQSQGVLVAGFLILLAAGGKGWSCLRDIREQWPLLLPALAVLTMYALVHTEPRYWAGFIVLLWLGMASAVRVGESAASRRLVASVTTVMAMCVLLIVGVDTMPKASVLVNDLFRATPRHTHWRTAESLRQAGLRPGDKVGLIGGGTPRFEAQWARVARVQIIAEITTTDVDDFLAADKESRSRVMAAFARAGAKFVVAQALPTPVANEGWQKVGDNYFLYSLATPRGSS